MRTIPITLLLATVCFTATTSVFGAADGIFPASTPGAAEAIHWNGDGYFVVNGKPTFISSGEIHYARVPRELWKDRILRAKAMGLNTVQTYVMWNAHEGTEGHFDFSGNLDLDAWLTTIQECGMYADVRPGPYVCAEWENGGIPAWLCDKSGMLLRVNDPQYLSYVDKFESKVFDIIAKHQIQKGGNVLMVQLENEYPNRWGTDSNPYLDHLRELARAHGLEIPLFNSGLHHGNDPAGNRPFGNRTTPWFSTEFWTGWIGLEGDMSAQMAEEKIRGTWKIIGFGGAGYDYYVVHGGSNFGYSKGAEVTASYDYSAPIGEAGQLRNVYFPLKRAALFAQAFSDVLTASKDGRALIASTTANVQTFARTSTNGTVLFLADAARYQNNGRRRGGQAASVPQTIQTQIKLADGRQIPSDDKTLTLTPGEIRPILTDFVVQPDPKTRPVIFDYAATAILTRIQLGDITYLVCYGAPGDDGEVKVKDQTQLLTFTYPQDDAITTVDVPDASVKLLVMNTDLADRTWIVGKGNARSLVIGPHYASTEGELEASTNGATVVVYSAAGRKEFNTPPHEARDDIPALKWSKREGALEATGDDSKWAASPEPKPMEQYDDYPNGWGWYRTTIHREAAGNVTLRFTGAGDVLRLFVNGQRVAGDKNGATLSLQAGDNELAVLCWTEGRPKMYNFTGPTGLMAAKGIWGPVMLTDKPIASISNWRVFNTDAVTAADNGPAAADFDDSSWPQVRAGGNSMNSRTGYAWFRAAFDVPAGTTQAMLLHQGVDDEGEFFLNGQSVGKHVGWNIAGSVDLSKALKPGTNVLAIRVKNNEGSGGMAAAVDIVAMKGGQEGWHFHPGLSDMQETPLLASVTNWREFLDGKGVPGWMSMSQPNREIAPNTPLFFRADFTMAADPMLHQPLSLRTTGLKSGSVWINGHNLGPYKNAGNRPTEMYVPECWLKNGANTMVIFDAEGASPAQTALHPLETWVKTPLPK
ncbi:MAG TPA: beta-galactosidase [Verrucomicrobiae bacterium]